MFDQKPIDYEQIVSNRSYVSVALGQLRVWKQKFVNFRTQKHQKPKITDLTIEVFDIFTVKYHQNWSWSKNREKFVPTLIMWIPPFIEPMFISNVGTWVQKMYQIVYLYILKPNTINSGTIEFLSKDFIETKTYFLNWLTLTLNLFFQFFTIAESQVPLEFLSIKFILKIQRKWRTYDRVWVRDWLTKGRSVRILAKPD